MTETAGVEHGMEISDGARVGYEPAELVAVAVAGSLSVMAVATTIGNAVSGLESASLRTWDATTWANPFFVLWALVPAALAWWEADRWVEAPSVGAGPEPPAGDRVVALAHLMRARRVALWAACLLVVASAASVVELVTSVTSAAGQLGRLALSHLVTVGGTMVGTVAVAVAGLVVVRLALTRVAAGWATAGGGPASDASVA